MEDEKKIRGHENRVDAKLDQERPQRRCFLFFGDRSPSHLSHFAVACALGRSGLLRMPDFHLRPRPFFLPSSSLLAENMADPANKYPENVSGPYYVDDQCIDCDLCRETAPANT